MRPHRNPTRRNRNIGTAKQGHGQDNRAGVPLRFRDSKTEWRRGHPHTVVTREIGGHAMPFLVEETRDDCVHACTVDDIAAMLALLPRPDVMGDDWLRGIQGVVLRQPTRKEQTHAPVWARMGNSVGPSDRHELDRLIAMATSVERARRGHTLHFDLEGIRRVQLFHSVPHELGHSVDM
ncbi:MAG: hypothetical protein AAF726_14445, partial [Planctomycetota bacterium]